MRLSDPGWAVRRQLDDFLPDHGHLMHLYVIRQPDAGQVWHLHPGDDLERRIHPGASSDVPAGQ